MDPTTQIALYWLMFASSHMVLASRHIRPRLVGALGPSFYRLGYTLVAIAIFMPLLFSYLGHRHAGPLLWAMPMSTWLTWTVYVGIGGAFVLMAAGFLTPSPVIPGAPYERPQGVHWLTRHAIFMGTGVWGLMHLIPNGYLSDVVFFGGFPLFAVVGCWHQDRRKLAEGDERFREFYGQTPFFPFTGRQTLRGLRELSPLAVVFGVGITVLIRVLSPGSVSLKEQQSLLGMVTALLLSRFSPSS